MREKGEGKGFPGKRKNEHTKGVKEQGVSGELQTIRYNWKTKCVSRVGLENEIRQ